MQEQVVLVNKNDKEIGYMDKLKAHQKGILHRAISVFIFNSNGKMLIQRRALDKYHTPGIWSNTACSHPRENEKTIDAASRRLYEEMGMNVELEFGFSFLYRAEFSNGLIEHELDHVFIGFSDLNPIINRDEVCDFKYVDEQEIEALLKENSNSFSPWFKICYKKAIKHANTFSVKQLIA